MRVTGLSGLDTENMVKQLMKAESMKLTSLRKSRLSNVWKQENYQASAKMLKTFQSNFLSMTSTVANNFKSPSNYTNLIATIKGTGTDKAGDFISVSASDAAKVGSYSIKVNQLASKDVYKSTALFTGEIAGEAGFDASKIKAGDSFTITLDGTAKSISLSEVEVNSINSASDKNAKFVELINNKLKSAFGQENVNGSDVNKVTMSIDPATSTLSIKANVGHTASISGGYRQTSTQAATAPLTLAGGTTKGFTINVAGVDHTISVDIPNDTPVMSNADFVKKINEQLKEKNINVSAGLSGNYLVFANKDEKNPATIIGASSLGFTNDTVMLGNSSMLADMGMKSGDSTKLDTKESLEKIFGATGTVEFSINGIDFKFDKTDSIDSFITKINNSSAGVKMTYDNFNGSFKLESNASGAANVINLNDTTGFFASTMNLQRTNTAQDAVIVFNGVTTTRPSNDFTIDGIRISLANGSVGEEYNFDFKKDTTKTVEFINKFVEEYNKLVDDLKKYYDTPRPKSDKYSYYEPLTDEEKSEMSDKQIEQYEAKAKVGLLYNDPILKGIATSMRSMLYEPVTLEDGRKVSLYEFGITTTKSYNDGGKIEVDAEKLKAAINERGEDLAALFTKSSEYSYSDKANKRLRMSTQGITERLDDIIKDAVNTNGSIFNKAGIEGSKIQNDLGKLITKQDEKISDMLKYLRRKENDYYMMFSKLEAAMTNANNQMASLQSLIGSGMQQ